MVGCTTMGITTPAVTTIARPREAFVVPSS
jgi:hypothetical protein